MWLSVALERKRRRNHGRAYFQPTRRGRRDSASLRQGGSRMRAVYLAIVWMAAAVAVLLKV